MFKMRISHREKQRIARKLSPPSRNKKSERGRGRMSIFSSEQWLSRRMQITLNVFHKEQIQKQASIQNNLE